MGYLHHLWNSSTELRQTQLNDNRKRSHPLRPRRVPKVEKTWFHQHNTEKHSARTDLQSSSTCILILMCDLSASACLCTYSCSPCVQEGYKLLPLKMHRFVDCGCRIEDLILEHTTSNRPLSSECLSSSTWLLCNKSLTDTQCNWPYDAMKCAGVSDGQRASS